jgi:nucleoside-diphosphate-sugar epimerase
MNVLVPGGCGYIGAMLVPLLLADGHRVTVFDTQWWGRGHLPDDNGRLSVIKGDVRDAGLLRAACDGMDAVIYLASVSNNDMHAKNPDVFEAVNVGSFPDAVAAAARAGVKRFIYASSVAAYGASDVPLSEEATLEPTTPYGEAKYWCERWLKDARMACTIVRMASVCGYSPHQRFDLTVNRMVHDACRIGAIRVNGGEQWRSHIHIHDACAAYRRLLDVPAEVINAQVFNFVAENQTVRRTALIVAEETGAIIQYGPATDDRSYLVDGTKASDVLDFVPKKTVRDAVRDLKARFDSGMWADSMTNPQYMNIAHGLV